MFTITTHYWNINVYKTLFKNYTKSTIGVCYGCSKYLVNIMTGIFTFMDRHLILFHATMIN